MLRLPAGCVLAFGLVVSGCGGASPAESPPASAAGAGGSQVDRGAKLYGANCASCHGAGGEGSGGAPAVVGSGALPLDPPASAKFRKVQFHTALDVGQWVVKNMPPKAPGSLHEDEYWAILAFDLKANGVDLGGKTVEATTAQSFVLHP